MENATIADSLLIAQINEARAQLMVPVVIYISLMMVSGLIGNIMVIVFYGFVSKMTTNTYFIVVLALFDLIASGVTMPNEIVDVIKYYSYESTEACRGIRFINYIVAIGSGLTLVAIAIDRYNRIYRISATQITIQKAKIISLVIVLVSLFLSWPALVFYTTVPTPMHNEYSRNLTGSECTTTKDISYRIYILAFNGIHFLVFLVTASTVCFLYARVGKVIFRHRKALLRHYKTNTAATSASNQISMTECTTHQTEIHEDHEKDSVAPKTVQRFAKASIADLTDSVEISSDGDHNKSNHGKNERSNCQTKHARSTMYTRKKSMKKKELDIETLKVTIVMIIVSALMVVSFLPYLCLMVWLNTISAEEEAKISGSRLVVLEISIRSYLLNSGLNPWVYGIMNSAFREYFLQKCFGKCFSR